MKEGGSYTRSSGCFISKCNGWKGITETAVVFWFSGHRLKKDSKCKYHSATKCINKGEE